MKQQQQNVSSMINTTVEKEQDYEQERKSVGLLDTTQVIDDDIAIPSQALSGTFNNCTITTSLKWD